MDAITQGIEEFANSDTKISKIKAFVWKVNLQKYVDVKWNIVLTKSVLDMILSFTPNESPWINAKTFVEEKWHVPNGITYVG